MKSSPLSPQIEKACAQQRRPKRSQKKKNKTPMIETCEQGFETQKMEPLKILLRTHSALKISPHQAPLPHNNI